MQYECPLQVALMGSWQTSPSPWNLQFLQHALFLSLNTETARQLKATRDSTPLKQTATDLH